MHRGEPEIGSRRVNPGETNASQITGMANEDKVNEEGTIFYDIRFFAWIPKSREKIRLIINVEAQKKYHTGYSLTTRGVFYGARMISAQLEQSSKFRNTIRSKRCIPSGSV